MPMEKTTPGSMTLSLMEVANVINGFILKNIDAESALLRGCVVDHRIYMNKKRKTVWDNLRKKISLFIIINLT